MIENEHQYRMTKAALNRFKTALAEYQPSKNLHPKLATAQREAFEGQIETLEQDILEYENLKQQTDILDAAQLESISTKLVQARVAAGLTQAALAKRLGMKEQQIQRYEATHYASASLSRVVQIAKALQGTPVKSH